MSQPERENMEVDILYVGAGPATLASALHLMNEIERRNAAGEQIEAPSVLVIPTSSSRASPPSTSATTT